MPYVIEVPMDSIRYPKSCPYCETAPPTMNLQRKFKVLQAYGVVAKEYRILTLSISTCEDCARYFVKGLMLPLIMVALSLVIFFSVVAWSIVSTEQLASKVLPYSAIPLVLSALFLGVIGLLRGWRGRKLNVPYFNNNIVTFTTTSEEYARQLAEVNNTKYAKKLFVMKVK